MALLFKNVSVMKDKINRLVEKLRNCITLKKVKGTTKCIKCLWIGAQMRKKKNSNERNDD